MPEREATEKDPNRRKRVAAVLCLVLVVYFVWTVDSLADALAAVLGGVVGGILDRTRPDIESAVQRLTPASERGIFHDYLDGCLMEIIGMLTVALLWYLVPPTVRPWVLHTFAGGTFGYCLPLLAKRK